MTRVLVAVAMACLAARSNEAGAASCPGESVVRAPFVRKLADAAGPGAHECGFVTLEADASGALACAKKMLGNKKSFLVAIQRRGIDSYVWEGIAADAEGQLTHMLFDSDTMGGICHHPNVVVARCKSIVLPAEVGEEFRCLRDKSSSQ